MREAGASWRLVLGSDGIPGRNRHRGGGFVYRRMVVTPLGRVKTSNGMRMGSGLCSANGAVRRKRQRWRCRNPLDSRLQTPGVYAPMNLLPIRLYQGTALALSLAALAIGGFAARPLAQGGQPPAQAGQPP